MDAASSDERISAYLDGELSPADRERFEQQLRADPQLAALLDALRLVHHRMQELPTYSLPPGFSERVLQRIAYQTPQPAEEGLPCVVAASPRRPFRKGSGWRSSPAAPWVIAAAAMIAAVLLGLLYRPPARPLPESRRPALAQRQAQRPLQTSDPIHSRPHPRRRWEDNLHTSRQIATAPEHDESAAAEIRRSPRPSQQASAAADSVSDGPRGAGPSAVAAPFAEGEADEFPSPRDSLTESFQQTLDKLQRLGQPVVVLEVTSAAFLAQEFEKTLARHRMELAQPTGLPVSQPLVRLDTTMGGLSRLLQDLGQQKQHFHALIDAQTGQDAKVALLKSSAPRLADDANQREARSKAARSERISDNDAAWRGQARYVTLDELEEPTAALQAKGRTLQPRHGLFPSLRAAQPSEGINRVRVVFLLRVRDIQGNAKSNSGSATP